MPTPTNRSVRDARRESLITDQLLTRASRDPDYQAEANALRGLARALASSDDAMLDLLAREAARLCNAGSAGISVLESPAGRPASFRWAALAGHCVPLLNTYRPFDDSVCGITLELGRPELFRAPQQYFSSIELIEPPVVEALLVPIPVKNGPWGAIWVMSHDSSALFDAEDLRLLTSLADFTGAAMEVARLKEIAEQRAAESEAAQAAIRDVERHKDAFIATLSHELRSPLAPVSAALQTLRRLAPGPAAAQPLDIATRQLARLQRLIGDLFDASRLRSGKVSVTLARCLLGDIVKDAVTAVTPMVDIRRHRLLVVAPEAPVYVIADAVRLTQVLENVLSNAAKYSPEGSRIQLEVSLEREAGQMLGPRASIVRLTVSDTGYGIPVADLPGVFDMYAQAGAHVRREGGLGIGLALVKYLVEAHRGTVSIRNNEQVPGTTVSILLPIVADEPDEPGQLDASRKRVTPCRIMLVDDDVDTVEALAALLALEAHIVQTSTTAHEALEKFSEFAPDVALIDLHMPQVDGFALMRALRGVSNSMNTIFVAVTGSVSTDEHDASLDAGFDYHLPKPVDFDELTRVLDKQCGSDLSQGNQGRHDCSV
ncbi:ATP-binding protein [Pararobbsia silviterrae]|uniref:histidine kinase n=1 Tax=Pararobbsia silviterrae TaxID=1792498 RepID=A0A494XPV3_9BURK|nr:ATP-binding protein [Pararobbsia silviterrae]RKP49563.1 response regulator [Pararobbsia silviterrae]